MTTTRIVGSYLSPYVRKVLACLGRKGIPYEIDPITPFFGDDGFERLSPLRRVPVLVDDEVSLADSTVICEYLEERYPEPRVFPVGAARRARARWLEEFADTRMGDVLIWRLFHQVVIRRYVFGESPDLTLVARARDEELPAILAYLEGEVPSEGFLDDEPLVADYALASFFRNAAFARCAIDGGRFPKTAAYVARVLGLPELAALRPFEELMLRTPIAGQRDALIAAGAPIAAETLGGATPRRGVMSV